MEKITPKMLNILRNFNKEKFLDCGEVLMEKTILPIVLHCGSLDYDEYVIDPKNKDSAPDQIGEVLADYMEVLSDEDWLTVRAKLLRMMRRNRRRANIKKRRLAQK